MIIVLLAAAVISGIFGDITDSIIILVVVILNAILGVFQEAKAEEAINALREMSSPEAHVKRDGTVVSLKSDQLVVGDVVLLESRKYRTSGFAFDRSSLFANRRVWIDWRIGSSRQGFNDY